LWYPRPQALPYIKPYVIYIPVEYHGEKYEKAGILKNKMKCPLCLKSEGTNMLRSMPSREILTGFYVNEFQRNKEMGDSPNSYYLSYFTMKVVLVHLSKFQGGTLSPLKPLITIVVQ
jgi:hypothetical protein